MNEEWMCFFYSIHEKEMLQSENTNSKQRNLSL